MKTNTTKFFVVISAVLVLPAFANDARVATYTSQLRSVRVTELARETAKIVAAEKADARVSAAADAVTAAVSLTPPSAPLVVGAVAKSSPEAAAAAAGAAVTLQPTLAARICKAAVSAAPGEAEAIVGAMCKARPASFYAIGVVTADAAPKASDKVLPAITGAVPTLKPLIARAQADFVAAKRTASLALVLKHAENVLGLISRDAKVTPEAMLAKESEATMATRVAAAAVTAPQQLPPFVPGGSPPAEINAATTAEASPSDRAGYSSP